MTRDFYFASKTENKANKYPTTNEACWELRNQVTLFFWIIESGSSVCQSNEIDGDSIPVGMFYDIVRLSIVD